VVVEVEILKVEVLELVVLEEEVEEQVLTNVDGSSRWNS
jgi:hypothetical protein